MSNSLFIGLLSGTSLDAIDAALVSFEDEYPQLIKTLSYPMPAAFKEQCLAISTSGHCSIDEIGSLDAKAGELFANAVIALINQAHISPKQIRAIGSHGQNLRHRPDLSPPFTLQIGDPNIIAERTGILTIADFRRRDIAAGGQGAPLAPAFHAAAFGSPTHNRVILNIGGMSNITLLPADKALPIRGFDTGPGNCLMDSWAKCHLNTPYDMEGRFAASGSIHTDLLQLCLKDPYFSKIPPKSTGREYFNLEWLKAKIAQFNINIDHLLPEDIQATLLALTAHSVTNAIREYGYPESEVFVCGGGAHNRFLMESLSVLLKGPVHSTDILGVPPDWVEAMLFAWLAKQTLEGKAGNCPAVTGASKAIALGGLFGYVPPTMVLDL